VNCTFRNSPADAIIFDSAVKDDEFDSALLSLAEALSSIDYFPEPN